MLSGTPEKALASSESTLVRSRGVWQCMGIIESTGEVDRYVWEVCLRVRKPVSCCLWISEVAKLWWATETSCAVIRQSRYLQTIAKQAVVAECTLIIWWTSVRQISFKNPKPVINIPPMHVTTAVVILMKSSGAWQLNLNMADCSYAGFIVKMTGIAFVQTPMMGKRQYVGPCW